MASRLAHAAFLSSALTLLLALLLVTASVYKAPTSFPRYPKQHLLKGANHHQKQQQRQREAREVGREEEEGVALARELVVEASVMMPTTLKSWPHLVGLDAEEAKKKILEENPNLQVLVVPEGSMMTMDVNPRRVRIFKNADQKVTSAPRVG